MVVWVRVVSLISKLCHVCCADSISLMYYLLASEILYTTQYCSHIRPSVRNHHAVSIVLVVSPLIATHPERIVKIT